MAVSITETIGFSDQFVQLIEDNQADLQAKGLDVTTWITSNSGLRNDALVQTTKQDDMEAAAKAQTKVAQASVKLLYDTTSTRLDAVMGVLGKNTPLAKQASKLRSSIIKQTKKKETDSK